MIDLWFALCQHGWPHLQHLEDNIKNLAMSEWGSATEVTFESPNQISVRSKSKERIFKNSEPYELTLPELPDKELEAYLAKVEVFFNDIVPHLDLGPEIISSDEDESCPL
jgi:hypothetical protein